MIFYELYFRTDDKSHFVTLKSRRSARQNLCYRPAQIMLKSSRVESKKAASV